jgi:hypothetical protein
MIKNTHLTYSSERSDLASLILTGTICAKVEYTFGIVSTVTVVLNLPNTYGLRRCSVYYSETHLLTVHVTTVYIATQVIAIYIPMCSYVIQF